MSHHPDKEGKLPGVDSGACSLFNTFSIAVLQAIVLPLKKVFSGDLLFLRLKVGVHRRITRNRYCRDVLGSELLQQIDLLAPRFLAAGEELSIVALDAGGGESVALLLGFDAGGLTRLELGQLGLKVGVRLLKLLKSARGVLVGGVLRLAGGLGSGGCVVLPLAVSRLLLGLLSAFLGILLSVVARGVLVGGVLRLAGGLGVLGVGLS